MTKEELYAMLDGADETVSSTQMLANITGLVAFDAMADDASVDRIAEFLSGLSHDQCMTMAVMLGSVSQIVTIMLRLVAHRHAVICDGKHPVASRN